MVASEVGWWRLPGGGSGGHGGGDFCVVALKVSERGVSETMMRLEGITPKSRRSCSDEGEIEGRSE